MDEEPADVRLGSLQSAHRCGGSEVHVVVGPAACEDAGAVGGDRTVELDDGGVDPRGQVVLGALQAVLGVRMGSSERGTGGMSGGTQHVEDGELGRVPEARPLVIGHRRFVAARTGTGAEKTSR